MIQRQKVKAKKKNFELIIKYFKIKFIGCLGRVAGKSKKTCSFHKNPSRKETVRMQTVYF